MRSLFRSPETPYKFLSLATLDVYIWVFLVIRSPCMLSPRGRGVAPSVPWLMLSWAGALVALATFGRPAVTLQGSASACLAAGHATDLHDSGPRCALRTYGH